MSRLDLAHRPRIFGNPVTEPYSAVSNVPKGVVIDGGEPLHEQLGPDEPEHDSLRDWFVENSQEPLDEGRGTPLRGLWNAYVYRYIHPEITSHDLLAFRAEGDAELCAIFGMDPDDPLDHSTLARSYWKKLDGENRKILWQRCAHMAVHAAKAGFEVNPDASLMVAHHLPEALCEYPEIDPNVEEGTVRVTDEQKAEAGNRVERFLTELDLDRPEKGTIFDDMELIEPWKRASIEGRFIEGMADTYDDHDTGSGYSAPCGETLRKPIRDLAVDDQDLVDGNIDKAIIDRESAEERVRANKWSEQIEELNFDLLEEAQSFGMFDRPVTICVDGSAIPHRPQNRDAPDSCIKNASSDESVWCYEHVTISAVDCRRSLKLGSMMMRDKGDQADIVMELLLQVKEHLNIGWVIWDSGFDKGDLISFCNHHGIRFCARKTRGGDIVEEMAENPVEEDGVTAIRPDYTYTSGANCDLFAVKRGEIGLSNMVEEEREQASLHDFAPSDDVDDEDEDDEGEKWILWATNSESLDENNIIAHGMLYRIRWSIETSYRVIKERFKASTTSISDALRVWVWKLATVLYNAWVLLRILIRDAGAALDPGESAIRTHSFQRILKTEFG